MSSRASAARYSRALFDVALKESDPRVADRELSEFAALLDSLGSEGREVTFADPRTGEPRTERITAEALTKAANAVHAAAKARDLKALIAANGDLTTACETCHKAYKPSLPTEGVVHQNPHSESHAHN